eukprot:4057273-Alexandrium_andersonii.AAC.1
MVPQPAGAVAARRREPPALEAVEGVPAEPLRAARAARLGVRGPAVSPADLCVVRRAAANAPGLDTAAAGRRQMRQGSTRQRQPAPRHRHRTPWG